MDYSGIITSEIKGIASDYGFVSLGQPIHLRPNQYVFSFIKPGLNRVLDFTQSTLECVEISTNRNVDEDFNEELFLTEQKEIYSKDVEKTIKDLSLKWDNISIKDVETEANAIIKRRIGQEKYRKAQIELWNGKCSLTGINNLELLNGSHAKSWKHSNDEERLDPYNGFLFEARIDRLFDKYLITFDNSGKIIISLAIDEETKSLLGINENMKLLSIFPENIPYLEFHRKKFFEKERFIKYQQNNEDFDIIESKNSEYRSL